MRHFPLEQLSLIIKRSCSLQRWGGKGVDNWNSKNKGFLNLIIWWTVVPESVVSVLELVDRWLFKLLLDHRLKFLQEQPTWAVWEFRCNKVQICWSSAFCWKFRKIQNAEEVQISQTVADTGHKEVSIFALHDNIYSFNSNSMVCFDFKCLLNWVFDVSAVSEKPSL